MHHTSLTNRGLYRFYVSFSAENRGTIMIPYYKRRANLKWDRRNLVTVGCKVKRLEAQAFQAYCKELGKTPYTVLSEFIMMCIPDR